MMIEKDKVGLVLGMANANSFGDPTLGTSLATNFITNGAGVIFHVATATGIGVILECAAKGIMAIGADSGQDYLAEDTVITSAMKCVDNAVYATVKDMVKGTLKSDVTVYDLSNDGVDIAHTTRLLNKYVFVAVEEVKEKIVPGEIKVPSDSKSFEKVHGDRHQLV